MDDAGGREEGAEGQLEAKKSEALGLARGA
jgi:hypothetical protein